MVKDLIKKGDLVSFVKKRASKKKVEKYLDMIEDLLDFKEDLTLYKKNISSTEKYVNKLISDINNLRVTKEEAQDNFVTFIKGYEIKDWGNVIKKLQK